MFQSNRAALAGALTLVLALTGAAPGFAATDIPPATAPADAPPTPVVDPEALALGHDLAGLIVGSEDRKALIASKIANSPDFGALLAMNPAWQSLMIQAGGDTYDSLSQFQIDMTGKAFAQAIPVAQLRVGVAFFHSAQGEELLERQRATSRGETPKPVSAATNAEVQRLRATPDGAGFFAALGNSKVILAASDEAFKRRFVVGFIQRFGELAEDAAAKSADPSPPTWEELEAAQLAHMIFVETDVRGRMAKAMASEFVESDVSRPQWRDLMEQSIREAFTADQPQLELIVGKDMAKHYTKEELAAATAFLRTAGGRAYFHKAMNTPNGKYFVVPPGSETAYRRLLAAPGGRSFLAKVQKSGSVIDPVSNDLSVVFVPTVFKIFGQKAAALELSLNPN